MDDIGFGKCFGADVGGGCFGKAAREFAQFGIRVAAIAPGIFGTPMLRGLPQEAQDSLGAAVPFPKRLGEPREFAELVLFMVRTVYLNGEVVRLDGALRMAPR